MLIVPSRRQFLTGLGAGAGLVAATGVYALDVEPLHRLVVTHYSPTLPRWDPALRLRVAVLADFHICEPYMPFDRVTEIIDATNALKPDLVLMLGDYPAGKIAWRKLPLEQFARMVEGLKAPLGTHAILGNHDWWDDHAVQRSRRGSPAVKHLLEARGIPLMAHEPDIFADVPDRVSLTLAGHTHGGQVRLFGHSPAIRRVRGHDYAYGHVIQDGRHLIVSGGFGMSRIPVRFGVPPEIVLLELGGSGPDGAAA
jgi:predicted MPP superfamily phosphohydrolase